MKKFLIGLGILGLVIFFIYSYVVGKYNTMVTNDEKVRLSWSQVENQYQRRSDLIPNIVETVKGYADHENETFTAVTQARSNATKTNIDINNASEVADFYENQQGLSQALSRLMMLQENYPTLKADTQFTALLTELSGTENRISTERMRYNEEVKDFNIYIRKFPNNLFAGFFGFEKFALFESVDGAELAPKVEF